MRLETRGYKQNGRGEVEATLAVLADDATLLLEDMLNISKAKDRSKFAQLVARQFSIPEDWAEAQLLDLLAQARVALEENPKVETTSVVTRYEVLDGRLSWRRDSFITPLANFTATVVQEIIRDNGLEEERFFIVKGALASGKELREARVPASSFASMNWVPSLWGAEAVAAAGLGLRDRLREAIQLLSGRVPIRRIFVHTGWRTVAGKWVYLHAGGAIGGEGIEVDLEDAMLRFSLPPSPEDVRSAMEISLDILKVAPHRVTVPLWSSIWLAVLAEILRPDFTLWLYGPTGNLKSTLAALAQGHFGCFDRRSLPASFQDTRNYLEKICFLAKDALLVVDDFHPAASKETAREMEQTALRLIRSQGNLQGRGRMRPDTSTRPAYPPRGLVLVTGEQLPSGHSTTARLFAVEIDRREVNIDTLSDCQLKASRLPHATAGFLRWVCQNWDDLSGSLPREWQELRQRAYKAGPHLRLPESIAYLALSFDCGLRFAEEVGAIEKERGVILREEAWHSLLETAGIRGQQIYEENPSTLFLNIMRELLSQKMVFLKAADGHEPLDADAVGWVLSNDEKHRWVPKSGADCIGWADADFIYLMPEDVYRRVARFTSESSSFFPVKAATLWRHLAQEGLLFREQEGRNTVVVWLEGGSRRVLKMKRNSLTPNK